MLKTYVIPVSYVSPLSNAGPYDIDICLPQLAYLIIKVVCKFTSDVWWVHIAISDIQCMSAIAHGSSDLVVQSISLLIKTCMQQASVAWMSNYIILGSVDTQDSTKDKSMD